MPKKKNHQYSKASVRQKAEFDVERGAFGTTKLAEDARTLDNKEVSEQLSRRTLQLVGIDNEENLVEAIESRVLNAKDRRAELEDLLDALASALPFEHPAVQDTLERLIRRWSSWCSDNSSLLAPIYDRLIILRIARIGPEHQEIADRLMGYAEYLAGCGRNLEAQNCLSRAVSIRKNHLGKSASANLSYAQAVTRLGCLMMSTYNYQVAERHLKVAADLLEDTRSILKLHAIEDLGTVYVETGRREEAEAVLKKALSVNDTASMKSVTNCAIQLGGIYLHWRRLEDAFALFDFSLTAGRAPSWTSPKLNELESLSDQLQASNNPYLELFQELNKRYSASDARSFGRSSLVRKYSWAIPDEAALLTIMKYAPLVEIGAGTGYWAALLRNRGANVIAYDANLAESGRNGFIFKSEGWSEVLSGTESVAAYHPDRTLFICWPPDKDPMAFRAVAKYKGRTLIYIGEESPGCTGDDDFHRLIQNEWKLQERVDLPRWHLIRDSLFVYTR